MNERTIAVTTKADDDLLALAERCEAATGADDALDRQICLGIRNGRWISPDAVPDYTASLDAALTLVPEWPNHGGYRLTRDDDLKRKFIAELWEHPDAEPGDGWHRGRGANMPLALCAASLRAMASREDNGGE